VTKLAVRKREARIVRVRPSAKRAYIPIHVTPPNIRRAHEKVDACVVKRNVLGKWGWHECPHHLVYIEETA